MLLIFPLLYACEKDVSTSPATVNKPLGFISLNSEPSNAKIFVDGRNTGLRTPDSLNWLEEKEHFFTLKLDYYRDTVFSFLIDSAKRVDAFIDFNQNPLMLGRIFVKTNVPGSDIFLNDSATGRVTPDTFYNVIPGNYKVTVSAPEHRSKESFYTVKSNITTDAAFFMKDTSEWVDYNKSNSGMTSDFVLCVAVDNNNNKWIGTSDGGLLSFDGVNWKCFNTDNSFLPDDYISTLKVDVNNNLWIGTLNGAVKYDGVNYELFDMNTKPVMKSNVVTDIEVSADGLTPWIATTHGVLSFNGNNWYLLDSTKTGLPHKWITSVEYDGDGRIWFGSQGFGIANFKDGKWLRYKNYFVNGEDNVLVDFPSNFVSCIATYNSTVWIGFNPDPFSTIGGLSYYYGTNWITEFSPLPTHVLFSIKIEENNRKWISTKEGLLTFRNFSDRLLFKTDNTVLETNNIRDAAFDKVSNVVWVATYGGGLYKFKRDFE